MPTRRLALTMGSHPVVRVLGALITIGTIAIVVGTWKSAPRNALFLLPGLPITTAMAFGLRGAVLDLDRGRVFRWWGLRAFGLVTIPIFWKRHPLSDFDHIVRGSIWHSSDKGNGYYTYSIALSGPGVHGAKVYEGHSLPRARRVGEEVAVFLTLPLKNEVDGGPTRQPHELGHDAVSRLFEKQGHPPEAVAPPARVRVEERPDGVVYEIAPSERAIRSRRHNIIAFPVGLGVAAIPVLFAHFGAPDVAPVIAIFGAVVMVPVGLNALYSWLWGREPRWIALERDALVYGRRILGVPLPARSSLSSIEELYVRWDEIMIVGDRLRRRFSPDLPREHVQWLLDDLLRRWWIQAFGERGVFR